LFPELKIILYLLFVAGLFFVTNPVSYILISIVVLMLLLRVPFESLKRGWVPITILVAFTFLSNIAFRQGEVLYITGPFVITKEGLGEASARTVRLFFMIAGAKILTGTTSIESLMEALKKLMKPFSRLGIPVNEFISTMGLTVQSLPGLKEQILNMYRERVQKKNIRGFWNRAKAISTFLMPLFVKSMESPEKFFEKKKDTD
jgi:energy-coupling factor transport system permease protein